MKMRRAEITIISIIFFIVTSLIGAYAEKEYGITISIEKAIDNNTTQGDSNGTKTI